MTDKEMSAEDIDIIRERIKAAERSMMNALEKDLFSGGGPITPSMYIRNDPWKIRLARWWYRQRMKLAELIMGHELDEKYNEDWD